MRSFVARPQRVAPAAYKAPPVGEYEAWFAAERIKHPKGAAKVSAAILRRIVLLRQAGDSFAEIGRCTGLTREGAARAYDRLPEHLK